MNAKLLAGLAAAAVVLFVGTCSAAAVDMDYTGPLDSYTGLPAESGTSSGSTGGEVKVSGRTYYSQSKQHFVICVGSSGETSVTSNVVSGFVTTQAVSFEGEALSQASLFRNGTQLEKVDYGEITAPGKYVLKLGKDDASDANSIKFTIVSEETGALNGYTMPTGFTITDATLGGKAVAHTDSYISMQDEGDYIVNYVCDATQSPYSLTVTVDHTAPVLALSAVKDGKADGPVSLADAESGAVLSITMDGQAIKSATELTDRGQYTVRITDKAGNSTDYQFIILTYFNVNSFVFFALFAAGIAALCIYLWRAKTHLRVR